MSRSTRTAPYFSRVWHLLSLLRLRGCESKRAFVVEGHRRCRSFNKKERRSSRRSFGSDPALLFHCIGSTSRISRTRVLFPVSHSPLPTHYPTIHGYRKESVRFKNCIPDTILSSLLISDPYCDQWVSTSKQTQGDPLPGACIGTDSFSGSVFEVGLISIPPHPYKRESYQ